MVVTKAVLLLASFKSSILNFLKYKHIIIENFRNIYGLKKINLKKNLLNIFDKDIKVNCFEPLNEFNG